MRRAFSFGSIKVRIDAGALLSAASSAVEATNSMGESLKKSILSEPTGVGLLSRDVTEAPAEAAMLLQPTAPSCVASGEASTHSRPCDVQFAQ